MDQVVQDHCRGCLGADLKRAGEKDGFFLWRCGACGTVQVDPCPSEAELAAFYSGYAKTGSYLRKKDSKLRRSAGRVRRMLKARPPGKKFLDVGCSVGYMAAAAAGLGCEAHGIDIDSTALDIARKNFKGVFEHISIRDLAARGDTFDMVYMCEVIEHVPDPDGFIAATAKVMAPGAILYITAPDAGHFGVPKKFTDWNMVCPPEHLTYFTRKGMISLLARHGLDVETFQIAFKPGMKAIARKRVSLDVSQVF